MQSIIPSYHNLMSWYFIPYITYIMPHQVISYDIIPYHMSCHNISHHIKTYQYHTTQYKIILPFILKTGI